LAGHVRSMAKADGSFEQILFPEKVQEFKAKVSAARGLPLDQVGSDQKLAELRQEAKNIREEFFFGHSNVNLKGSELKQIRHANIDEMGLDELETFFDEAIDKVKVGIERDFWTSVTYGTIDFS